MTPLPDTAHLVVGLLAAGCGMIFLYADRQSPASRALALCLLALGARFLLDVLSGRDGSRFVIGAMLVSLESLSIFAGIEWARRSGRTATGRTRTPARWLFNVALLLVLVYWLLAVGYTAIYTELATTDAPGVIKVRGFEFALLAPVLGAAILCTSIAILLLLFGGIDKAEAVRLRAVFLAGPFLLAALVVGENYEPVTVAFGLIIFLGGAIQYLIIHGQRGQFMSQFLSPEVAKLVKAEGLKQALKRERRPLSVVVCDLRGFTAYARERDSAQVMDVLQDYYEIVGDVAERHSGTVKDHAGDGVLILVGAPIPNKDHARAAAHLALELMERGQAFLQQTAPELGMGVGVATGKATVGAIRGAGRYEYVAVGNVVNIAARLCSRADDGEVLVDQRTCAVVRDDPGTRALEKFPERLKGFPEAVPVYALSNATVQQDREERRSRRRRRRRFWTQLLRPPKPRPT